MSEIVHKPRQRYTHPLTEEFIVLVGGGMTPREAAMSLVGEKLPLRKVENAIFDWEFDPEVQERIEALVQARIRAAQSVRQETIERLINILNFDIRTYYRNVGDDKVPKIEMVPITQWTKRMSASVKKFKVTTKEDMFGNSTETVAMEFFDPSSALRDLRDLAPEVFELITRDEKDAIDVEVLERMSDEELITLHSQLLKAV